MSTISVPAFTRKLREVVADEPKAFAYDLGLSLSAVYNYLNGRVPATEVLFRIARYTGEPGARPGGRVTLRPPGRAGRPFGC